MLKFLENLVEAIWQNPIEMALLILFSFTLFVAKKTEEIPSLKKFLLILFALDCVIIGIVRYREQRQAVS